MQATNKHCVSEVLQIYFKAGKSALQTQHIFFMTIGSLFSLCSFYFLLDHSSHWEVHNLLISSLICFFILDITRTVYIVYIFLLFWLSDAYIIISISPSCLVCFICSFNPFCFVFSFGGCS